MPCNAVATVEAKISEKTLAAMITPEVILPLMQAYLKSLGIVEPYYQAVPFGYRFSVNGENITIKTGGVVTSQNPTNIRDYLKTAAGRILQIRIQKALSNTPGVNVTQSSRVSGTMVLRVEA